MYICTGTMLKCKKLAAKIVFHSDETLLFQFFSKQFVFFFFFVIFCLRKLSKFEKLVADLINTLYRREN